LVQFLVFLLNFLAIGIDLLELLGELGQAFQELLDDYNSEHEAFAFPTESFDYELESDALQDIVQKAIFDNGTEELRDLCQIHVWVLVKEAILIEETM